MKPDRTIQQFGRLLLMLGSAILLLLLLCVAILGTVAPVHAGGAILLVPDDFPTVSYTHLTLPTNREV